MSVRPGSDAELFNEPNLTPRIKYMKSSASESVENGCFNLEWLFQFGMAQPFFPPGSAGNFGFGTALIQKSNFS